MAENIQYPPRVIKELSELFALKDSTLANYKKGAELVDIFNSLGYNDAYTFESGIGIKTPDIGESLSRIQYVTKRLEELNKKFQVPQAVQELISRCREPEIMATAMKEVIASAKQIGYAPQVLKVSEYTAQVEPTSTKDDKLQLSKKQLEDKILGVIPEGHPVVFVSYSWDNESHKDWVGQLADDLTAKGAYVLFDQYLEPGTSISDFMELGIDRADKIIVIGTESYRLKSLSVSGGAAVEGLIIRNGILANIGTTKIIPCLRQGTFASSFPSSIADRLGEDFTNNDSYANTLESLWQDINNKPTRKRPVIGQMQPPAPRATSVAEAVQTDFRRDNDVRWLKMLLQNFSFRLMQEYIENGPYVEKVKLCDSFDTWSYIINQVTFILYDRELEKRLLAFYKLWKEVKSIGVKYYEPMNNDITRFKYSGLQMDVFLSPESERDFHRMSTLILEMRDPLKDFALYVMSTYEIDIESLSCSFEVNS